MFWQELRKQNWKRSFWKRGMVYPLYAYPVSLIRAIFHPWTKPLSKTTLWPALLPIFSLANYLKEKGTKWALPVISRSYGVPISASIHLQLAVTKPGLFHPIYNWWRGPVNLPLKFIHSWWLNHPIWKICASQIGSFPWTLGWQFSQPTGGLSHYLQGFIQPWWAGWGFLNHQQ